MRTVTMLALDALRDGFPVGCASAGASSAKYYTTLALPGFFFSARETKFLHPFAPDASTDI